MFPQLIAGPIVRYGEVAKRMKDRKVRIRDIENGLKLFTVGLGLKVILANQIGTLWNLIMTAGAGSLHVLVAWLGAFAYSCQIYFDFWGCSVKAKELVLYRSFRGAGILRLGAGFGSMFIFPLAEAAGGAAGRSLIF